MADSSSRGIRASNSRWSWWGKSIKYLGADGKHHFLNRKSSIHYLNKTLGSYSCISNRSSNNKILNKITTLHANLIPLLILAEQGDGEANYKLGTIYDRQEILSGITFPNNPQKALQYYQSAADVGHAEAQLRLGSICGN